MKTSQESYLSVMHSCQVFDIWSLSISVIFFRQFWLDYLAKFHDFFLKKFHRFEPILIKSLDQFMVKFWPFCKFSIDCIQEN